MQEVDNTDALKARIKELEERLVQNNKILENLAIVDADTDLLNLRGFNRAFAHESDISRRTNSNATAIFVHLVNLKNVIDTSGIQSGNMFTKYVAEKMKTTFRSSDYTARISQDEFMVFLPNTRHAEGIKAADKLKQAAGSDSITLLRGKHVKPLIDSAVIKVSADIASADELIVRARLILSKSRKLSSSGSDSSSIVSSEKISEVIQQLILGESLYSVLQPIFDITNKTKVGYELLTRTKIKGFELPEEFFTICFQSNTLALVDFHCFKTCIFKSIPIFPSLLRHVNLFPVTLMEIPLKKIVSEFPGSFPKQNYCIEISEQHIVGDPTYLLRNVMALKKEGVKFALDNVGFGSSSLESLLLLEPEVVKIDRNYVQGISRDKYKAKSVFKLVRVANAVGVKYLIATGVEDQHDFELLKNFGVKYMQGYLFGKPAGETQ
ncbi:MAG: EAL domain-containing protein [Planctomycetes bacterium]|nr:EAL domain-containing protein [Planctomycetota bacterium]